MKRHHKIACLAIAILFQTVAFAQQSLGDAARAAQTHKNSSASKKVITNDDIESAGPITQTAVPEAKAPEARSAETAPAKGESTPATEGKPAEAKAPAMDSKSVIASVADWKNRLDGQKKVVADLGRELNLMEREHQVRVATYYADAGNQLRDSKKWFEDEKKWEEDHAARQKDVADAKQKLEDMRDEARRAGAPASILE